MCTHAQHPRGLHEPLGVRDSEIISMRSIIPVVEVMHIKFRITENISMRSIIPIVEVMHIRLGTVRLSAH